MLKIGDFSSLSQVSIKTLRYYDERGLLSPAHVDPQAGHYSASQFSRLRELYLHSSMPVRQDDESYVTEIQVPVSKSSAE